MAGVRQCLGIDIGTHSVRVAELTYTQGKVKVRALAEARLEIEPGLKEAKRQAAIISQITGLLKRAKVKSRQAVFCVPGQTVFIRRLRLPATSPERLARIIRFEAREQIPFPLEKTILEYQVFKTEVDNEVEVLLVAIKREFIDNFMKLVQKTGLKILAVSVSSLALHNFSEINTSVKPLAARLGEGDAKPGKAKKRGLKFGKKKDAEEEEPAEDESAPYDTMELEEIQAQVNLGASIMDLSLPKAGAERLIGFTRSVPVAGNSMDKAIMGKLNLDSAEEARRIKEEECAILASDFEISGDTEAVNMPACEAATSIADRIVAEIRRSLDFFLSQPDGVAVDSIMLSGGLARMSFLSNYIEEKMGLPVELAELKKADIEIDEELAGSVSSFAIPLGLALQGLELGQIKVDFLPQDIKNLREFKTKRPQLAVGAGLLALMTFLSCQAGNHYIDVYKTAMEVFQDKRDSLQAENGELAKALEVNEALNAEFLNVSAARAGEGHQLRRYWLDVTQQILRSRPPDVLVESLEIVNTGRIEIAGVAPQKSSITRFGEALKTQDSITEAKITSLPPARQHSQFEGLVQPFTLRVWGFSLMDRTRSVRDLQAPGAADDTQGGDAAADYKAFIRSMMAGGQEDPPPQ